MRYIPESNNPGLWLEYFWEQTEVYRTKNVLVMWGDDFTHKDASNTF